MIELIYCRPYGARITERACALRAAKARKIAFAPPVLKGGLPVPREGLIELEKCVKCPDARKLAPGATCSFAGCTSPSGPKDLCRAHAGISKAEERRNMESCVKCGRLEAFAAGWNAEKKLCGTCTEKMERGKSMANTKKSPCAKCGKERGAKGTESFYAGLCGPCRKANSAQPPPFRGKARGVKPRLEKLKPTEAAGENGIAAAMMAEVRRRPGT